MPKETITSTVKFVKPTGVEGVDYPTGANVANTRSFDLAVGWSPDPKAVPWVQIHTIPSGWRSTGDWTSFDLDEDAIDQLIRTLRRVKRKVWPTEVMPGVYDDGTQPGVAGPTA